MSTKNIWKSYVIFQVGLSKSKRISEIGILKYDNTNLYETGNNFYIR